MREMPAEEEALTEALSDDSEASSAGVTSPVPPKPHTAAPPPRRPMPPRSSAPQPAEQRPAAREMPAEEEALVEALGEDADDIRLVADLKGQLAEASTVLARILELMGEQATIEVVNDDDPDAIELNIKGDGSGLLIGRHGQTLDALEYIVNRVLAHRLKDAAPISIDTESYRARRRGQLHRMALAKGEEAKREHQAVTLEPMPPRDRRIVHLALKDDPLITTRSSGEGFMRAVEIVPVDERREGPGDRGGRDRRRGRGGGPRAESQPPLGQQGGFSHGQKRIV
jgi:spoIIIJ-associated protein